MPLKELFLPYRDEVHRDPRVAHALNVAYNRGSGVKLSVSQKAKSLRKWGERTVVGTGAEVVSHTVGTETEYPLLSSNGVTSVVSSSASDTQNIVLHEGHTIDNGDLTFRLDTDNLALTGTTPVTLPTALRDVTRARLSSPAVGDISFYQGGAVTAGVPDDDDQVHCVIPAGDIQSQKGQTAISSVDYYIVTSATGSVLSKVARWAQFRIEVKPVSESEFYPLTQWVGVSDSSGTINIIGESDPYEIIPANYDIRLVVKASQAGTIVAGGFQGFLASII